MLRVHSLEMAASRIDFALTLKFISWKQPFPGFEHIAHFPMSPLTRRPLHGGQTSQGKCAQVAPTYDPGNDIDGGVAGVVSRSGDTLESEEKKIILKV